jgi:hypothetical protein
MRLDLDTIAWERGKVALGEEWIAERCYADLIEATLPFEPELVFLDSGREVCLAHCRSRPSELLCGSQPIRDSTTLGGRSISTTRTGGVWGSFELTILAGSAPGPQLRARGASRSYSPLHVCVIRDSTNCPKHKFELDRRPVRIRCRRAG